MDEKNLDLISDSFLPIYSLRKVSHRMLLNYHTGNIFRKPKLSATKSYYCIGPYKIITI